MDYIFIYIFVACIIYKIAANDCLIICLHIINNIILVYYMTHIYMCVCVI